MNINSYFFTLLSFITLKLSTDGFFTPGCKIVSNLIVYILLYSLSIFYYMKKIASLTIENDILMFNLS